MGELKMGVRSTWRVVQQIVNDLLLDSSLTKLSRAEWYQPADPTLFDVETRIAVGGLPISLSRFPCARVLAKEELDFCDVYKQPVRAHK